MVALGRPKSARLLRFSAFFALHRRDAEAPARCRCRCRAGGLPQGDRDDLTGLDALQAPQTAPSARARSLKLVAARRVVLLRTARYLGPQQRTERSLAAYGLSDCSESRRSTFAVFEKSSDAVCPMSFRVGSGVGRSRSNCVTFLCIPSPVWLKPPCRLGCGRFDCAGAFCSPAVGRRGALRDPQDLSGSVF